MGGCLAGLEASLATVPSGHSQRTPSGDHTCLRETGFVGKVGGESRGPHL